MPYSYFPVSLYNDVLVTDTLKKFKISERFKKSTAVENYRIKEEDTPESLAYLLYNDTQLSWLILMLNDILDRNNEWPYSAQALEDIMNRKYGTSCLFLFDSDIDFDIHSSTRMLINGDYYSIKSIDRQLNKIVTEQKLPLSVNTSDSVIFFDDSGSISSTKTIRRIVYEDLYSVHHFVDGEGFIADPRSTVDGTAPYQEQYSYLYQYVNGQAEEYIINNMDYEISINDRKRDIILVLPEYKNILLSKISRLFSSAVEKDNNVLEIYGNETLWREINK